ncbi:M23 family metallopeptidase [Sulfurovum sp. bin170]|uniref:M23 family metallopeptidase n=1 Tax=Sulfurovum sp. bin170 TaxID=2695268 RepID=UPI0013E016C7|nr:M23 family metallopeptidase [Sulfurovum sp. bin170]NEW60377.1 M23 family metallopeptidase [Sulfurovum sp. bin170]
MRRKRRTYSSGGSSKSAWIIMLGLSVGAGAYIFTSPAFEREQPVIETKENIYWNRRDPLEITVVDNLAIKSYDVKISDGQNSVILANELILEPDQKSRVIKVEYPKKPVKGVRLNPKSNSFKLTVTVTDRSNWGFFQGNTVTKDIFVEIDYKQPDVNILSNSYSITQGGSGLVVFQVKDESLKEFYLEAEGKRFEVTPYKKDGYYAALVAWPFKQENFSARIIAEDMAENKRVVNVPFYTKTRNYKVSWIKARDNFIDGKISDLANADPQYALVTDRVAKLKIINEDMRIVNEKLIHTLSEKVSKEMLHSWKIKPFYPLKNAAKVASYGDERHYYYGEKSNEVSQSYHVGLDMASTKMAQILTSNDGRVVYSNYNGIYGNMPMVDHGLGLFTIYGHCSNILVQEGEDVVAGAPIAQTGVSGLALGDHLHFGVLVQGIEVRPEEWMDKKWIRDNVDKIFKEADKIIDGK